MLDDAPWLSVTHKRVRGRGQKSNNAWKDEQLAGTAPRDQCVCVCVSARKGRKKAARKGEVGKMKGRKRTTENTDIQR